MTDQTDKELERLYKRCDVSNNRTDNPLSFDEFKTALLAREARQVRAVLTRLSEQQDTMWIDTHSVKIVPLSAIDDELVRLAGEGGTDGK